MTALLWIGGGVAWLAVASAVAVIVGKAVKRADADARRKSPTTLHLVAS